MAGGGKGLARFSGDAKCRCRMAGWRTRFAVADSVYTKAKYSRIKVAKFVFNRLNTHVMVAKLVLT